MLNIHKFIKSIIVISFLFIWSEQQANECRTPQSQSERKQWVPPLENYRLWLVQCIISAAKLDQWYKNSFLEPRPLRLVNFYHLEGDQVPESAEITKFHVIGFTFSGSSGKPTQIKVLSPLSLSAFISIWMWSLT